MSCEKTSCGLPKGSPFAIEDMLVVIRPTEQRATLTMSVHDLVYTAQESSTNGGIDALLKAIDALVAKHAPPGFAQFERSNVHSVNQGTSSKAQVVVNVRDAHGNVHHKVFEYHDTVVATAQAYVNALNHIYKAITEVA